jgi:hypothetical protein
MRSTFMLAVCLLAVHPLVLVGRDAGQATASDQTVDALVSRFQSGTGTPVTSYRALRMLEAWTRGGALRATLTAWTSLDPVQGFQYSVVEETGSDVIREKVLRAALDAERAIRADGDIARSAFDGLNYAFSDGGVSDDGLLLVAVHPKRVDKLLIEGRLFLSPVDADLVRIEGVLVRRPSFWTRRVEVVRRFTRIHGVRVPTALESTAHVLFVGRSRFSMTYEYQSVNGRLTAADTPAPPRR